MGSRSAMWPIPEANVRRQAHIFPNGAAAQAIAEFERRSAAGEAVEFFEGSHTTRMGRQSYIIVGPKQPESSEDK